METAVKAVALVALLPGLAWAEGDLPGGPPLGAHAFEALTLGKRMDTYDPQHLYGLEEFLPGRRSIWKDAAGCMRATWEQVGHQICFRYEDNPEEPVCWVYTLVEGELWGWFQGRPDSLAVRLIPGNSAMDCDWLGA